MSTQVTLSENSQGSGQIRSMSAYRSILQQYRSGYMAWVIRFYMIVRPWSGYRLHHKKNRPGRRRSLETPLRKATTPLRGLSGRGSLNSWRSLSMTVQAQRDITSVLTVLYSMGRLRTRFRNAVVKYTIGSQPVRTSLCPRVVSTSSLTTSIWRSWRMRSSVSAWQGTVRSVIEKRSVWLEA